MSTGIYRPRYTERNFLQLILKDHFSRFRELYDDKFALSYGPYRDEITWAVEEMLKCGDPEYGFALVKCENCKAGYFLPFSCKKKWCPSCAAKRSVAWSEWLEQEVFRNVPHAHYVLTMPRMIRWPFRRKRKLLSSLASLAGKVVTEAIMAGSRENNIQPGIVSTVHSEGERLNWNPHCHLIVTQGGFAPDGSFWNVPPVDLGLLGKYWQEQVLRLLVEDGIVNIDLAKKIDARYQGFTVYCNLWENPTNDSSAFKPLAEYVLKPLIRDSRIISYGTGRNSVIVKCRPQKNLSNFMALDPMKFIALFTQHILPPGQKTIFYFGFYSNKSRGVREEVQDEQREIIVGVVPRSLYRKNWRRLLIKVFAVDPLVCPHCGEKMRIYGIIYSRDDIFKYLQPIRGPDGTYRTYGPSKNFQSKNNRKTS